MNDLLPPLLLVALFPLVGYLMFKHLEREAPRIAAKRKALRERPACAGNTTDLEPLRERLLTIRADFAAASHKNEIEAKAKHSLVARSREMLRCLGFFRHHPALAESEQTIH